MYLSAISRWWTPKEILQLRNLQPAASRLASSCKAPNGHSQPQIGAAVPEQQRRGGREPQDEDQRRHQEVVPAEVRPQRVEEGEDVDDRQLRLGVPADPQQGERQETQPNPVVEHGPADEPSWKKKISVSKPSAASSTPTWPPWPATWRTTPAARPHQGKGGLHAGRE